MAEWTGEVPDEQLSDEERLIRRAVKRLLAEAGCAKADVVYNVLKELVAGAKSL